MTTFDTILESARKWNEQALMKLYDICSKAAFNASYNIVSDRDDAEEITQDAIMTAFSLLGNFEGTEASFIAWVKKIAVNKSIDRYRRESRMPSRIDVEEFKEIEFVKYDDDELYSVEQIKKVIESLPEGYRIVITLRLLEDMEYEEIARVLGINESSVRSQYARGIARLKSEIGVGRTA